ncbi:hypothetical protein BYT27DRAFT_6532728 [Phlegmacium glaucopus]|nr:hypothetical protein BYT27DRAFT_6532728 [Phlegmacium glaucopus]
MYSDRRPWGRREPSDASIEALDLADYARSLARYTQQSPSLESSSNTYLTAHTRPFSLQNSPSLATSSRTRTRPSPHRVEQSPSEEIDISHFPKWSQGWYSNNIHSNPTIDPDADIYTPIPPSSLCLNKKSVFDPGYIHDPDTRSPPLYSPAHNNSTRDILPWSNESPQYEPPLEPALKEERIRMLEKEFGEKGTKEDDPLVDQNGKPVVGTVDDQGRLVTVGPNKRIFIRAFQILLALTAAVPSIYAAVAIKASDPKDTPPPANKPPAYVLYIISVITVLILLYLFVIHPCCIRKKPSSSKHPLGASGMMVLPLNGPGGKKPKKPKTGKGKPGANSRREGDLQINLIVDPTAFKNPDISESEDSEDDDGLDEGGKVSSKKKKKRNQRKRRGLFEGLAMEEQWLAARAWLKKMTMVDVAGLLIWGATFIFVLTGKRCPSGGFGGWCNAYNVSSAAACLLCVAFGVSIFFDVQDLHSSKQSPRTRT